MTLLLISNSCLILNLKIFIIPEHHRIIQLRFVMASLVDLPVDNGVYHTGSLVRLASNPMFSALQQTLLTECMKSDNHSAGVNKHHSSVGEILRDLNVGEALNASIGMFSDTKRPSRDAVENDLCLNMDSAFAAVQEANLLSEFRLVSGNPRVTELQTFYTSHCSYLEGRRAVEVEGVKGSALPTSDLQQRLYDTHAKFDRDRLHLTNRISSSLQLLKVSVPAPSPHEVFLNRARSRQLNVKATELMNKWYEDHVDSPYPNDEQKIVLATEGGITLAQVKAWFANRRNRTNNTKPKRQKLQVERKLLTICTELKTGTSNTPRIYSDVISQLSNIVNGANIFSQRQLMKDNQVVQ